MQPRPKSSVWRPYAFVVSDHLYLPFAKAVSAIRNGYALFEHEDVAAAMRTLPARWRTVLWYAEVMGGPPRKIAPILGIEPNAVSALLIRSRAGLRAAYERQSPPAAEAGGTNVSN